jgi:hypothetical protein
LFPQLQTEMSALSFIRGLTLSSINFSVLESELETTQSTSLGDKRIVPVGQVGDSFTGRKVVTPLITSRHTEVLFGVAESGDVKDTGTGPETTDLRLVTSTVHVAGSVRDVFTGAEVKVLVGSTETVLTGSNSSPSESSIGASLETHFLSHHGVGRESVGGLALETLRRSRRVLVTAEVGRVAAALLGGSGRSVKDRVTGKVSTTDLG